MVSTLAFHAGDWGSIPRMNQHIFKITFSPSHPFGVTKPSSSNSATSGKTYTSMSSEVAFSIELDSATFWDKGTEVPSLSQDKGTMGQAKILQNPGMDAEQNGTEQKRMLEYIKKMF